MNNTAAFAPMLEVTRGRIVECIHHGAAAIVNSAGELLAWYGNPQTVVFLRSSAKPFQALPFVERDGPRAFGFTSREISFICASHVGSEMHVQTAASLQARIDVEEAHLQCGTHMPEDLEAFTALMRSGEKPTPNRHNCSGKHTGMLAHARLRSLPLDTYLEPDHPIQKDILSTFGEMCSVESQDIELGVDGCSAPNFAIPLYNAALGFARLADPRGLEPRRTQACQEITSSMIRHPELVAGYGKFDTRLMETGRGRLVVKSGAEGYQAVGLLPGALSPSSPGIGIVLKISDGDISLRKPDQSTYHRARPAVMLEILRQLGALDENQLAGVAEFGPLRPVLNNRNLIVGERRPAFDLQR